MKKDLIKNIIIGVLLLIVVFLTVFLFINKNNKDNDKCVKDENIVITCDKENNGSIYEIMADKTGKLLKTKVTNNDINEPDKKVVSEEKYEENVWYVDYIKVIEEIGYTCK